MNRYISADYIYPIHELPIKKGVIEVTPQGEIIQLHRSQANIDTNSIEYYDGIIVPGFVNAHCHLELSHLKGEIETHTGLTTFLKKVIKRPLERKEIIEAKMKAADAEMERNGIVAVGDIANTPMSKEVKQTSKLYYHTFVEILGFEPHAAQEAFEKGLDLCKQFAPLSVSLTPHAPYSVCKDLFRLIQNLCIKQTNPLSIHNQESEAENKFFRYKEGPFIDFYKSLERNIDFFKAQARNSIQTISPLLPQNEQILLVHNTFTSYKDINFTDRYGLDVTWCFCPNANLYIEDQLPQIQHFYKSNEKIVLGTDSLASNHGLSILEEIKTIQSHYKQIPLHELLKWGTLNGAEFFGIAETYGSIEPGKKPGLNLIEQVSNGQVHSDAVVRKLF